MDLIVTSCRNKHFVDDKHYDKMCFGCFHVPLDEIVTYTKMGVVDTATPVWDHKHLHTPQEMVDDQSCESLAEARKCLRGVKAAIKVAGLDGRKKPKPKTKPQQVTVLPERSRNRT